MNLPDGTHLAYMVTHEAGTASAIRATMPDEYDSLMISASSDDGRGVAWEFNLADYRLGGRPALQVGMFYDSWPAFVQVPELFAALAEAGQPTLQDVVVLLESLGAVDETVRVSRYAAQDAP